MVQRRDINAPPSQKMRDVVRQMKLAQQQSKTGAAGVKDFGETGDAVWTDPATGVRTSVRAIPPEIEAAKDAIAAAEEDIQAAKDAIAAEVIAREGALADALGQLAELDDKLADLPDMDDVQQAITVAANGKNTVTVSAAAPDSSSPGVAVGDTWWQADTAGDIIGQWSWDGKEWQPHTITSEVIANLDVGKLTVTGTSRFTEAVVDRLFTDIFTAHKITANEITIAALGEDGELAPGAVRGVHIGDGQVSANKITIVGNPDDPDEAGLVANIAAIMQLAVENLVVTEGAQINEAVILKLAAEMITSGVLRTAEAGQRVVIDASGIVMYGTGTDGEDIELVRIGPSGENLITAGDTTISPSGVQARSGSFDSLTVGGDDLPDILAALPKGMVAWGQLTSTSQLDGNTSIYARRGEIQTALEKGRLYRIRLSEHFVEVQGSSNVNVVEELRYSYDGTPILPDITPNSGSYRGVFARNPAFAGNATTLNGMEFMLDTGSWTANRGFWLMWLMRPEVSGRPIRVLATSFYSPVLSIEDMGPSMPGTLKRWNDGDGGGSAPAPADPEPIVVRRTQTWDAASYGGDTRNGLVYQGTYSSYGNRYGGWVFYPAMRSALSGATIEKFEVYLVNHHWYYGSGGTAVLYPNDGSYKGILGSGTTSPNWPRGAGRWVTLPSSWYSSFASGQYRGVSVYTTNTGLTYYGQFKGSPTKFRATYRK